MTIKPKRSPEPDLPGRYLVYVPGGSMMGISRKLPDKERTRLKQILKQVMPEGAGVIVRTAAEGATEEELSRDVARLAAAVGVQAETVEHWGAPGPQILAEATACGADLIVLGRSGRRDSYDGGVLATVMEFAKVPVLLVP